MTGITVSGAAPKDFIRVYDHTAPLRQREHPPSWPAYIAKVGHKWYPAESITEQLMTRIGETLGMRMAESRLMICDGQIRFLSRYFLRRQEESLIHAADLLGGYLADEQFVADVGQEKLEQHAFMFEDFCEAIRATFASDSEDIILDLVRMIGFDALVGNQDRHLLNWGVIVHLSGLRAPRFSPIFDTARGLFWNEAEERLSRFDSDQSLLRYVQKAEPLIGWEGGAAMNHFSLVQKIAEHDERFRLALSQLCSLGNLRRIENVVEFEFAKLLSDERRSLIRRCLGVRMQYLADSLGTELC